MLLISLMVAAALTQQPPVPQPFPRPGAAPVRPADPTPPAVAPPPADALPPLPAEQPPAPETLGAPVYPGAQFLASYDAGRGQRFYLYGTSASFADLVGYYRNVLRERGDLVFKAPATHQFNTGRYRQETMAFPPSVTIKDYESAVSRGYPNPVPGGTPEAFRTVIQIVPPPPPTAEPARR